MKQILPGSSNHRPNPRLPGKVLRPQSGIRPEVSPQIKYVTGALTGLMLCTLVFYWLPDSLLSKKGEKHQLSGVLYLDPDADQKRGSTEGVLPFVKLNLYSDLNDNRLLDEKDLRVGSGLTDGNGSFSLHISRSQTFMTRIQDPQHEANENLASGSVQVAQPFLTLGGDGNVSSLTALRFEEVTIPPDAKVERAFIRLRSISDNEERPMLWISGELKSEDKFNDTPGNLSTRSLTQKGILWECQSWEKDHFYNSPDLSRVVQEMLKSRTNNLDMTFLIEGSEGIKEAYSSVSYAPQLVIQYDLPKHDYLLEIDPAYSPNNGMPTVRWLAYANHEDLAIPYQGNPPLCYGITTGGQMASFNWQSGLSTDFAPTTETAPKVQHLVMVSKGSKLLGLREGQLGQISIPDGAFIPQKLNGELPGGSSRFRALTFDPFHETLLAITQNRQLIAIDPTDFSLSEPLENVIRVNTKNKNGISHLVYHAGHDLLYYLQKTAEKELQLWSLDPASGQTMSIGPLQYLGKPIGKVISMIALPNDRLAIISGDQGPIETRNLLLEVDAISLQTEVASPYPNLFQLETCGCVTPPPHRIKGQVFDDLNNDRKRSKHEKAYPDVRVSVFQDANENEAIDDSDPLVANLQTDQEGSYAWQTYQSSNFLVQIDTSSLPAGIVLTSREVFPADFRGFTGGGQGPGKPFNATHRSRVASLKWIQLKVRHQENNSLLNWTTESENDEGTFYVMRSTDGISYETIGQVEARAHPDLSTQYEFTDGGILDMGHPVVAYRIRRVGTMGESFSEVVKLPLTAEKDNITLQVSPGDHRPVEVRYRTEENGRAQIRIINLAGKVVYDQEVITGRELRQLVINNDSWRSGIYYLQLETNQHSRMKKFIVK